MSDKKDATPATDAAAFDPTTCPHWGKGGRYVVDITNGQRIPVDENGTPIPSQDEPTVQTVKEKKRA